MYWRERFGKAGAYLATNLSNQVKRILDANEGGGSGEVDRESQLEEVKNPGR